jgi:hypothetical protein
MDGLRRVRFVPVVLAGISNATLSAQHLRVATNLDLFDEKYLFAGNRFLVYFVSSVPNLLIILLLLTAIGYLPFKLLPASVKSRAGRRVADWASKPIRLPLLGTIFAIIFIQFILRKCFEFGNLLLQNQLPYGWISSVLLTSDARLSLYFSALVAGTLLCGTIAWYVAARGTATTYFSRLLLAILIFLVAVEFLLLPVNDGVLISTQQLPRITELSGDEHLQAGQRGWVIWDSKDALTYFIYGPQDARMLLTLPRKDAKIKIVAYDDIFCVLFSANHSNTRPCPR